MKNELERAARHYAPPADALGRLDDKRAKNGRNDKIGALVVGLAIVGALIFAFVTIGTQKGTVQPAAGGDDPVVAATPVNGGLLYSKWQQPGTWHIFSYDPATGKETQLTTGSRDYGSDWSPDGTQIVYDHEGLLGSDIVIANADGSDPTKIASGSDPAWSPDGRKIAYVGDDGQIWVVNIDGTNDHAATSSSSVGSMNLTDTFDWNPAWSPDGAAIAYTHVAAHRAAPLANGQGTSNVDLEELRVWHEDGSDQMLTDIYSNLGEIAWSPDGSTLAFTGGPTRFHQAVVSDNPQGLTWPRVLLIPSNGGEVTPITPDNRTWAAGVTWSPDGTLIAYVDNNHSLVTMWPDGTHRRNLEIDPGGDEIIGPSWGVAGPSPS